MYYCTDCERFFETPLRLAEGEYAFGNPRQTSLFCPCCQSSRIRKTQAEYCRCCGRRLKKGEHIYCSRACMKNGERLYSLQKERRLRMKDSPIYVIIRALKEYNEKHKTRLSYGQFVAGGYI